MRDRRRAGAGPRRALRHQRARGSRIATALRDALVARLAARDAADWAAALLAAGRARRAVNDVAGAFALADALGLDPIVELPRADGTAARLTRNPITLSATPATYRSAPPPLESPTLLP